MQVLSMCTTDVQDAYSTWEKKPCFKIVASTPNYTHAYSGAHYTGIVCSDARPRSMVGRMSTNGTAISMSGACGYKPCIASLLLHLINHHPLRC